VLPTLAFFNFLDKRKFFPEEKLLILLLCRPFFPVFAYRLTNFFLFSPFSELCFWGERKENIYISSALFEIFSLDLLGPSSSNKITRKGGKKKHKNGLPCRLVISPHRNFVLLQKTADEYSFHRRAPPV
jgi:hypothetical protein